MTVNMITVVVHMAIYLRSALSVVLRMLPCAEQHSDRWMREFNRIKEFRNTLRFLASGFPISCGALRRWYRTNGSLLCYTSSM